MAVSLVSDVCFFCVIVSKAFLLALLPIECASAIGCSSSAHHVYSPEPAIVAPAGWRKVEATGFSLFAPTGWEFHQLAGVDSYVGEFVGEGIRLVSDYGRYSNPLDRERKPEYVVAHEFIGGLDAKVVSPRAPGHGITGVYFRNVGAGIKLCLWGKELTTAQQELVLKIFETIRFGGAVPRYVLPPPPAKTVQ